MATFRDDVRFLSWETIAEAERLEANRTFFFYVVLLAGNDGDGRGMHGGKRMRTEDRNLEVGQRRVPAKESPKRGFRWIRRKSRVSLMDSWNPIHEHNLPKRRAHRKPFFCLLPTTSPFPRFLFHLTRSLNSALFLDQA